MRIRIAAVPGEGQEKAAIVVVAYQELAPPSPQGPWGRMRYVAGHSELVEASRLQDRIVQLVTDEWPSGPCVFIDQQSVSGNALSNVLHTFEPWPKGLHRPHLYMGVGKQRQELLVGILTALGKGLLTFETEAGIQSPLIQALGTHRREVGEDGRLSERAESEAMVTALGIALWHPTHQGNQPPTYIDRGGNEHPLGRLYSGDPYQNDQYR